MIPEVLTLTVLVKGRAQDLPISAWLFVVALKSHNLTIKGIMPFILFKMVK